ncbi:MAG: hypothetical protein ACJAVI_001940 [Candidatus Azotimanducaceae bacterium]|jgi:hypothetical protein
MLDLHSVQFTCCAGLAVGTSKSATTIKKVEARPEKKHDLAGYQLTNLNNKHGISGLAKHALAKTPIT